MNGADHQIAKAAAKEAIAETFLVLGYDIGSPGDLKSLQADLGYLRRARRGSEGVSVVLRGAFITTAVSGIVYMLWEGFKVAVRFQGGGS